MPMINAQRAGVVLSILVGVVALLASPESSEPPWRASAATTSQTGVGPQRLFAPADARAQVPRTTPPRRTLRRGTLRLAVSLQADWMLNAEAFRFNLFPDVDVIAQRSRVESHTSQDFSWYGYIPGDPLGRVIVTLSNRRMGVLITSTRGRYMVLPIASGVYEVVQIDERGFSEGLNDYIDGVGDLPPVTRGMDRGALGTARAVPATGARSLADGLIWLFDWRFAATDGDVPDFDPVEDDGSIVDVMVVYTHGATTLTDFPSDSLTHSGPHAPPWNLLNQIRLAFDETNLSFIESGVQTRLHMVPNYPWEEITYVDSGDMEVDLARVDDLEAIQDKRAEQEADIVVVITSGDFEQHRYRGLTPRNGHYSIVDAAALNKLTFSHEIGHQFTLEHDWYRHTHAEGHPTPSSWATEFDGHGYIQFRSSEAENARSIMSTPDFCTDSGISCRRIARWSNPGDLSLHGLPFGIWQGLPDPSNEVRVLNERRIDVARRRVSACRLLSIC